MTKPHDCLILIYISLEKVFIMIIQYFYKYKFHNTINSISWDYVTSALMEEKFSMELVSPYQSVMPGPF